MVFRKGLPKSTLVILEISLDIYAIYLKITECKILPLVLIFVFICILSIYTITSYARLCDVMNALSATEI